jgi:hypothetical protein
LGKHVSYWVKTLCWILEKFRNWFELIWSSNDRAMKQIIKQKIRKESEKRRRNCPTGPHPPGPNRPTWPTSPGDRASTRVVFNLQLVRYSTNGRLLLLSLSINTTTVSSWLQHEIYSILHGQLIQGVTSPLYGLNRPNETDAPNANRWHKTPDLPPRDIPVSKDMSTACS